MSPDFSVLNIPFYTNLTSFFSNSIYAFATAESMELFKKTGNKLENKGSVIKLTNGQYSGIPLFQCQLKKDVSYLISSESMNYKIYKFIVIPLGEKTQDKRQLEEQYLEGREYKIVCTNAEHNITIYRVLHCEVKSKMAWKSFSKSREYIFKSRDDQFVMTYKNFRDHVEITYGQFADAKWIYNDNRGNVLIDGFFINNNYKLILKDGSVACEFDDTSRTNKWITYTTSEKMGLLRFANFNKPPAFSSNEKTLNHNNDWLTDSNEKVIYMVFVLINHQRYAK